VRQAKKQQERSIHSAFAQQNEKEIIHHSSPSTRQQDQHVWSLHE
jgi:hypothetical protein